MHRPALSTRPKTVIRRAQLAIAAVLMAFSLGLVGAALTPTAAWADGDPQSPTVRWAVTPADQSGKDGRASIQHALDAGESKTEHILVQNLGDREATFRLSAADGFTTPAGRFDMLASDQESTDAGTWIEITDEITVPAGEGAVVPFTITVPELAEPGDHSAGVAASVITEQAAADGTSLGVESRVGVKVTTRVNGELAPAFSVGEVATSYDGSWNPLRPGRVTATVDVTNTGNTRLAPSGIISAGTGETAFPTDGEQVSDLLPGDTRQLTFTIDRTWPTFYVPGELVVAPEVAVLDGTTATVAAQSVSFGTWAIPWPQLLVLLALLLIIAAITGNRRRGRRRLEALLDQAREEGRRSAAFDSENTPLARDQRTRHQRMLPQLALRARVTLAALATAASVSFISLTPAIAAPPADAPDSGNDGVGLHVTITERDGTSPTPAPTDGPTAAPTDSPTGPPTGEPTDAPTNGPTDQPSVDPGTDAPEPGGPEAPDGADDPAGDPDESSKLAKTGTNITPLLTLGVAGVLLGAGGLALRYRF